MRKILGLVAVSAAILYFGGCSAHVPPEKARQQLNEMFEGNYKSLEADLSEKAEKRRQEVREADDSGK